MKILFLCGSLEPGKDGVGDYTFRLASKLYQSGHIVSIIALNDLYCNKGVTMQENLVRENVELTRLSSSFRWEDRFAASKLIISEFRPDWISLQYVPFAFHPKGLPYNFSGALKKIGGNRKWHIMFHELWVGIEDNSGVKLKLWGWAQKQIILRMVQSLLPQVVHTQTLLYQKLLISNKVPAIFLPLFGNIPITAKAARRVDGDDTKFVIFGTIHPKTCIEQFGNDLKELSEKISRRMHFIFLGRNGNEQKRWVEVCKKNKIKYSILNERTEDEISQVLYNADFGLTSNPLLLAQKSGTIAAMLEHGLKVISVAEPWGVKEFNDLKNSIPSVWQYPPLSLGETEIVNTEKVVYKNYLDSVVQQFIKDLIK